MMSASGLPDAGRTGTDHIGSHHTGPSVRGVAGARLIVIADPLGETEVPPVGPQHVLNVGPDAVHPLVTPGMPLTRFGDAFGLALR